jgi:hypothetical protein
MHKDKIVGWTAIEGWMVPTSDQCQSIVRTATSGAGRLRLLNAVLAVIIKATCGSADPYRYSGPTQEIKRDSAPAATLNLLHFGLVAGQDRVRVIQFIEPDGLSLTLAILDGVNFIRSKFFVAATIDNPTLTRFVRHDLVACPDLSQGLYRHISVTRIDEHSRAHGYYESVSPKRLAKQKRRQGKMR